MGSVPPLLTFLLALVLGSVHRHRLIVIELLQAENRMLKERLRGKRIRFTDEERALLAQKAKAVGRKALLELDTIVSPDTLTRRARNDRQCFEGDRDRTGTGAGKANAMVDVPAGALEGVRSKRLLQC